MISQAEPRTPPRFVPTLTDMVTVPDGLLLPVPPQVEGPRAPLVPLESAAAPAASARPDSLEAWSEQITDRVMAQLEQRLPSLLEEHARLWLQSAAQALRQELPAMVREAVEATSASADTVADPRQVGDASVQRGLSAMDAANNDPG